MRKVTGALFDEGKLVAHAKTNIVNPPLPNEQWDVSHTDVKDICSTARVLHAECLGTKDINATAENALKGLVDMYWLLTLEPVQQRIDDPCTEDFLEEIGN